MAAISDLGFVAASYRYCATLEPMQVGLLRQGSRSAGVLICSVVRASGQGFLSPLAPAIRARGSHEMFRCIAINLPRHDRPMPTLRSYCQGSSSLRSADACGFPASSLAG